MSEPNVEQIAVSNGTVCYIIKYKVKSREVVAITDPVKNGPDGFDLYAAKFFDVAWYPWHALRNEKNPDQEDDINLLSDLHNNIYDCDTELFDILDCLANRRDYCAYSFEEKDGKLIFKYLKN